MCCSPWGRKESDTRGQVNNITSNWSEWSSLKILQIINTREETEKREPLHSLWECKVVHPLWKTVWRFLKKLKIELPYDPTILLLGIYPEKMQTLIQKDNCALIFIAALFTIAKTCKQPECPSTDEWIKMCIYTMEYYSAIKKQ